MASTYRYAVDAEGRPIFCPVDGQATMQSLPHDTASTYQCILCDRVYSLPQPPKQGRTNR